MISRLRRGFTLVETVLAVLILGGALAAILSVITTSVHQVGDQKAQAAVNGFAAGQMNRYLFDEQFVDVQSTNYEEVVVDGTWFQYKFEVVEIPNASIKFKYKHVVYHDPRHGLVASTGAEPTVPGMQDKDDPVTLLDKKFTANPILKDILLTVRWHGPGEEYRDDASLKLISRRARLL